MDNTQLKLNITDSTDETFDNENDMDINSYDTIIVAFSGGKDSTACVLHLLDLGISKEKIELWHHDVDGREGSQLMDWPVTKDYCKKFAKAFDLKIYFSWKMGGFEGEMNRKDSLTAPTRFETPTGIKQSGGTRGKLNTRQKFPQTSADLKVRWCSAYLKIDICATAIRNQERFLNKRTLVVTGERAQESSARAKYSEFEPHRSDLRNGKMPRLVDSWRPVHKWTEKDVWNIIKKYKVNVHPAYKLGWGRLSCAACIFGSKDQWASLRKIDPVKFETIAKYEKSFGLTIQRNKSVITLANSGTPYDAIKNIENVTIAKNSEFTEPIIIDTWELPAGAYGEQAGPS